jgi:hypothetical protein
MYIHSKGYETLHEHVPKKILPNEYGGNAGPLTELQCKFNWVTLLSKRTNTVIEITALKQFHCQCWAASHLKQRRQTYHFNVPIGNSEIADVDKLVLKHSDAIIVTFLTSSLYIGTFLYVAKYDCKEIKSCYRLKVHKAPMKSNEWYI